MCCTVCSKRFTCIQCTTRTQQIGYARRWRCECGKRARLCVVWGGRRAGWACRHRGPPTRRRSCRSDDSCGRGSCRCRAATAAPNLVYQPSSRSLTRPRADTYDTTTSVVDSEIQITVTEGAHGLPIPPFPLLLLFFPLLLLPWNPVRGLGTVGSPVL